MGTWKCREEEQQRYEIHISVSGLSHWRRRVDLRHYGWAGLGTEHVYEELTPTLAKTRLRRREYRLRILIPEDEFLSGLIQLTLTF